MPYLPRPRREVIYNPAVRTSRFKIKERELPKTKTQCKLYIYAVENVVESDSTFILTSDESHPEKYMYDLLLPLSN